MTYPFDLQKVVSEVLSFPSYRNETPRALVNYMMDLLDHADFRIMEQATAFSDDDYTNLLGIAGPNSPGGLLLCSAVPMPSLTNEVLWTETEEDPFNPTCHDGLLFAHAATSGRVDWVCKALAAACIDPNQLKRPLMLAALFGSQSRVAGPMYLLDSGLCQPDWAVVSEPTNLELITAHRGYLLFQLCFTPDSPSKSLNHQKRIWQIESHGLSAHSGFPNVGRNAVVQAMETIEQWRASGRDFSIHDLSATYEMSRVPDRCKFILSTSETNWVPNSPHMTVKLLSSPEATGPCLDALLCGWQRLQPQIHELFRWTTPKSAIHFMPPRPIYSILGVESHQNGSMTITIDYRPLPGQSAENIVRDIDGLARRTSLTQVSAYAELLQNHLPLQEDSSSWLASVASSCLSEVGVPPVIGTYNGCTEAWILSASQIESLVFGPGMPFQGRYQPNEYTIMSHLHKATLFYERLIRRLCCH